MVTTTKVHRSFIALLGCVFCLAMLSGTARAGTYEVYSCDPNHAGGGTPSWNGFHDVGLTAYSACTGGTPEGIVTRSVAGSGATSSGFQGASVVFDAPDGTTIDSIHAYFYLSRPGCSWGAGIKATSGDLGGRWVYALQPGYCGADSIGWVYLDWPINDKRVVEMVACGASTCDRSSEARAAMRSVRITINDPTPPSLTSPRGALWASGVWLAGTQDIAFDASDSTGIKRNDIQVDGQPLKVDDRSCDDTQRAPCPNGGMSATIDTRKITPDGSHEVKLETVDTAGNPTQLTKTIQVDNTAPKAPEGVTVNGGEDWRTSNTFAISWTNPPADGGAPIAAVNYRLCPSAGGPCVDGSRAGAQIAALPDLQVPSAGDWTLTLWLRDAAGNSSSDASATPVHLRFDPSAPSVAFEPPNPADPTLVSALASDSVSAVANGRIEIRRRGTNSWQALPSSYDGSHITARLDDEHLASGTYDLRAWAVDAAGNEKTGTDLANGASARVRLPLRVRTRIKAGAASRRTHRHRSYGRARVRTPFGQPVRLGGQLLAADGNPIAVSEVLVYSRERKAGAPWVPVASLKTSTRGFFAYRAPKGPSRTIRFRFGGTATIRPSIRQINILVPARSTIHADRKRLLNGEYVHLRGRLLGSEIPAGGKLVEVQVLARGHWRTFATTPTSPNGRWQYEYRFDGTRGPQTYRLRLRVPLEANYPYAVGRSKGIDIHVQGL